MSLVLERLNLVISQARKADRDLTLTEDFLRASRRKTCLVSFEDAEDALTKLGDICKPLRSVTVVNARRDFATKEIMSVLVELLVKNNVSALHFISCDISLLWVSSVLGRIRLSSLEQLTLPATLPAPTVEEWAKSCSAMTRVTHVAFSEQRVHSAISRDMLWRALGDPFARIFPTCVLALLEKGELVEFSCDAPMNVESACSIINSLARHSSASLQKLALTVKGVSEEETMKGENHDDPQDRDPRCQHHTSPCNIQPLVNPLAPQVYSEPVVQAYNSAAPQVYNPPGCATSGQNYDKIFEPNKSGSSQHHTQTQPIQIPHPKERHCFAPVYVNADVYAPPEAYATPYVSSAIHPLVPGAEHENTSTQSSVKGREFKNSDVQLTANRQNRTPANSPQQRRDDKPRGILKRNSQQGSNETQAAKLPFFEGLSEQQAAERATTDERNRAETERQLELKTQEMNIESRPSPEERSRQIRELTNQVTVAQVADSDVSTGDSDHGISVDGFSVEVHSVDAQLVNVSRDQLFSGLKYLTRLRNLSLVLPAAGDASEALQAIQKLAIFQKARRVAAATGANNVPREERVGVETLRLIGSFSGDALTAAVYALPRLKQVEVGSASEQPLLLRSTFFANLCSKLELLSVTHCQLFPDFVQQLARLARLQSLILREIWCFGLDSFLAEYIRKSPSLSRVWLDSGMCRTMPLPGTCEELFRRVQTTATFAAFVDNDAFVWETSWLRCMIDQRSLRHLTLAKANAVCRSVWNFFHRNNLAMMPWVTREVVRNCLRRVETSHFVPAADANVVEVYPGLCIAIGAAPVHLQPNMRLIGVPCEAIWKHKRKLDSDNDTAAQARSDLRLVSDVIRKVNSAKNTAVLRASCGIEFSLAAAVAHLILRKQMSLNEALCAVMSDTKPQFYLCVRVLMVLEDIELAQEMLA